MKRSIKTAGVCGALLMSAFTALTGCAGKSPLPATAPDYSAYEQERVLPIGGWVGPPPGFVTQDRYDEIAESGLNFILDIYAGDNEEKLTYADNAGIGYFVHDTGTVENMNADWAKHPSFRGVLYRDEPGASVFDSYGKTHKTFKEKFPDDLFYVNLFPSYALNFQIQTDTYGEYIDQYIEKVSPEVVSYDAYSLMENGWGEPYIQKEMLYNLETVANATKEAEIPYWAFFQSMKFDPINRAVTVGDSPMPVPGEELAPLPEAVSSVSGGDVLIGRFRMGQENLLYLVCNDLSGKHFEITADLTERRSIRIVQRGDENKVLTKNLKLELESGEGVLIAYK